MIGGTVIDVLRVYHPIGPLVWVNCREGESECALYLEATAAAERIEAGDTLWWQGRKAFYTPRDTVIAIQDWRTAEIRRAMLGERPVVKSFPFVTGEHHDIEFIRYGYSGASRPRLLQGQFVYLHRADAPTIVYRIPEDTIYPNVTVDIHVS